MPSTQSDFTAGDAQVGHGILNGGVWQPELLGRQIRRGRDDGQARCFGAHDVLTFDDRWQSDSRERLEHGLVQRLQDLGYKVTLEQVPPNTTAA